MTRRGRLVARDLFEVGRRVRVATVSRPWRVPAAIALCAGALSAPGLVTAAPAPAAIHYHECQHPVLTGVEVSHLRHVGVRAACRVALRLHGYAAGGHTIVACKGRNHNVPVLELHSFEGWRLRLRPYFHLVQGRASFAVGGTDFPASCG